MYLQRLNVMISRAQALLIIIGNPFTLSEDKNWETVVNYCRKNRAFVSKNLKNTIENLPAEENNQGSKQNENNLASENEGNLTTITHEQSLFSLLKLSIYKVFSGFINRIRTRLTNFIQNEE